MSTQNDLGRDSPQSERISQQAAQDYLVHVMEFSHERAERFASSIAKDGPLSLNKPFLAQLLQSADCLGVLRADDWKFNHQYLNTYAWIDLHIADEAQKVNLRKRLFQIIDRAKLYLVELGDSPYDMARLSGPNRGQNIQG